MIVGRRRGEIQCLPKLEKSCLDFARKHSPLGPISVVLLFEEKGKGSGKLP
jgi:hypothetical protein